MTKMDIKLPELGEGIESGDVLSVLVSEGDSVSKDQGLIELETDKASVEIPSTHAGKITKIHVAAGDTLKPGGTIVSLETSDSDTSPQRKQGSDDAASPPEPAAGDEAAKPPAGSNGQQPDTSPTREQGSEDAVEPNPPPQPPTPKPTPQPNPSPEPTPQPTPRPQPAPGPSQQPRHATAVVESDVEDGTVPAGPAMRRFAREVGVDLRDVEGTGEGGRITRTDVLRVVRGGPNSPKAATGDQQAAVSVEAPAPSPESPSFTPAGQPGRDDWGPVRIEKMPKIRQTIAAKMHESWTTIPRVTNFDDADITELEQVRQSSKADYASAGIKLTQMPFVIKACAMALRANPIVNASMDLASAQIIYKEYVHIGIAVDTERGLIVPSLRDADKHAIPDIARSLETLAETVRSGKFSVDDLRGSTFTISNLGAIGGTYSTPIINPPEAAILLIGRSRKMPVVVDHQFAVRLLMPLSLSYDHRLVDGAAAARFLNDVKGFLQSPSRLLLAP